MSNLSILRGVIAFIDNVDGRGAHAFAKALLEDPRFADNLPSFVTRDLLREVLEEDGPALRAIAAQQPTEIAGDLLRLLSNPRKGTSP